MITIAVASDAVPKTGCCAHTREMKMIRSESVIWRVQRNQLHVQTTRTLVGEKSDRWGTRKSLEASRELTQVRISHTSISSLRAVQNGPAPRRSCVIEILNKKTVCTPERTAWLKNPPRCTTRKKRCNVYKLEYQWPGQLHSCPLTLSA